MKHLATKDDDPGETEKVRFFNCHRSPAVENPQVIAQGGTQVGSRTYLEFIRRSWGPKEAKTANIDR